MERRYDRKEIARFEEDVFAKVATTEKAALEAGRKWAKSVGELVPVDLPLVREMVKEVFDFTEDVLRIQREFVHKMLVTTLPAPVDGATAKAHTPTTTHRTTKPRTAKVA